MGLLQNQWTEVGEKEALIRQINRALRVQIGRRAAQLLCNLLDPPDTNKEPIERSSLLPEEQSLSQACIGAENRML